MEMKKKNLQPSKCNQKVRANNYTASDNEVKVKSLTFNGGNI